MGEGANRHVGAQFLWNIDLRDFFPSVAEAQVRAVYLGLGYPVEAATFLAKLCCLEGCLPQGAPTSPMLANLAFAQADSEIRELSKDSDIVYTRYADDLSFSSHAAIPGEFRKTVSEIIGRHGFAINPEKTRLVGPRCRREVTGLVVNTRVSVPRKTRRQIRAMIHNFGRPGAIGDKTIEQLRGLVAYIGNYHPAEAGRYLQILNGPN
jgi:retron-type reverse transcriptase